MELKDQAVAPSLAQKLGDVPHVSGLLRRIAQLSGAGERVTDNGGSSRTDWLCRLD